MRLSSAGKMGVSHVALGLDLRQMSIDPHHEAQQPYAVGDPYNVPARQGLARMSMMQQQASRMPRVCALLA